MFLLKLVKGGGVPRQFGNIRIWLTTKIIIIICVIEMHMAGGGMCVWGGGGAGQFLQCSHEVLDDYGPSKYLSDIGYDCVRFCSRD